MPRFGPAGNPQAFYDAGYKSSVKMPPWLAEMKLSAYEYQCGRGVNIGTDQARLIGQAAAEHDIQMSIHAPYYINLASPDPDKQEKTAGYILASLRLAREMDAQRVILHPGSAAQADSREEALAMACLLLQKTLLRADQENLLAHCTLCPEVMGKNNQLGNLDEVLTLCRLDDRLLPCVDFGHLNARTQGGLRTADDFFRVASAIELALGRDRLKKMHVHFSRIEFTAGGEKQHHTLADTQFGPDYEPWAQVMAKLQLDPVIICESDGTQAEDAVTMRKIYLKFQEATSSLTQG